jgi:hypothetical protein
MSGLTEGDNNRDYYIRMILGRIIKRAIVVLKNVADTVMAPSTQIGKEKYRWEDVSRYKERLALLDGQS